MNIDTASTVEYPLFPDSDAERTNAMRHIAEAVHRVNEAVLHAVNSGVSVELIRTSRCHDQCGNWGDQVAPAILRNHPENVMYSRL